MKRSSTARRLAEGIDWLAFIATMPVSLVIVLVGIIMLAIQNTKDLLTSRLREERW